MSETKRPQLTTMEGMIWNANHVLQQALNPGIRGIPKGYFMTCAGICIVSTVQAGFMFSGSVGTGIFLKRNSMDGTWSNPVACGITGVGFGFVIGATLKDVIFFFPDEASIQTCFSTGVKLGAQSNITVGIGREAEGSFGASGSGTSTVLSIAYTKGAFLGASMEGAVVAPRPRANEAFYGPGNTSPADIIEDRIPFPPNKTTVIENVKDKLGKLALGQSDIPGEIEIQQAEAAFVEADKVAETVKSADDVVEVDAAAEAAKGN